MNVEESIVRQLDRDLGLSDELRLEDIEVFNQIYLQCTKTVRFFILSRRQGSDDIEDMIQEVFLRYWQQRKALKFKGQASDLTYLLGIARNVMRERIAAKSRDREHTVSSKIIDDLPDQAFLTSLKRMEKKDLVETVRRLLSDLPPKQRQIVDLLYFRKLTAVQASEQTGCSPEILRNRLCRAIKTLREKLIP